MTTISPSALYTSFSSDRPPVVALVTGAAGTLGASIVRRLARDGAGVVMVDLAGEKAREVARSIDAPCLVIEADLSLPDAPLAIMALVEQHVGSLDHLINNAGLNRAKTLFEVNLEDWEAVMAVNLRAPMLLSKAAIPFWRKRGAGSIVNIASRVWLSGSHPAYTSSKAGLVGLTRSQAVELATINVRANAVAPAYVDTPFTRQGRPEEAIERQRQGALSITPLGRVGVADDVANAVAFLASDQASFITGEVLHVCGGAQLAPQAYSFV